MNPHRWREISDLYWAPVDPIPWQWETEFPGWMDWVETGHIRGQIIGVWNNWKMLLHPDETFTRWLAEYPMNISTRQIYEVDVLFTEDLIQGKLFFPFDK